jgi:hypothetical protein
MNIYDANNNIIGQSNSADGRPITSTPGNFQTTSQKNANGEIINPTQQDIASFNSQFTTTKPITSEQLQSATPLNPPAPVTAPSLSAPSLTGFIADIQKQMAPTEQQTTDQNSVDSLMSAMLQQSGSKANDRATAMQGADFQAKQAALSKSASEMQMLQAEQDTLAQRLQSSVEGKGVTEGGLAPIANAQQRDLSVRSRLAMARYAVAQGDYALAQQNVNQAVEDKYSDRQTNITNTKTQIDYLQKKINDGTVKADKTMNLAIAERNRILEQQQKDLEYKKEDEKSIMALAMTALKNNPNDQQAQMAVNQAIASGDLKTAFSLLGEYQDDPQALAKSILDQEKTRLEMKLITANTDKAYEDIRKSVAEGTNSGYIPVGGETPFVANPNYNKLTTKQKTQADSLNNLVREISKYRKQVEDTVTNQGSALFGQNSALIKAQQAAIIFAAAQAEGTGALQKADRDVIDEMIPNPATFKGASMALFEGGKKGQLLKIDDQLKKYTNNLKGYGLTPKVLEENVSETTKMTGPDGKSYNVPNNQVNAFIKAGGKKQ